LVLGLLPLVKPPAMHTIKQIAHIMEMFFSIDFFITRSYFSIFIDRDSCGIVVL